MRVAMPKKSTLTAIDTGSILVGENRSHAAAVEFLTEDVRVSAGASLVRDRVRHMPPHPKTPWR